MVNGSPEAVLLGSKLPLLSHLQAIPDRIQHDALDKELMQICISTALCKLGKQSVQHEACAEAMTAEGCYTGHKQKAGMHTAHRSGAPHQQS